MATKMKIVEKGIVSATAKDLLVLSPLPARTGSPILVPPQPRFAICLVRVTCDRAVEQLLVSVYKASDVGTGGTDCTADAVDVEGGGQLMAGVALKNLTVAATKTQLLGSQQVSGSWGVEFCGADAGYVVMPGEHLAVRLDAAPAASTTFDVEVEWHQI